MNYTSIEQSKKLLELGLSPESADMNYCNICREGLGYCDQYQVGASSYLKSKASMDELIKLYGGDKYEGIIAWEVIPCWSVGALLEVMPANLPLYPEATEEGVKEGKYRSSDLIASEEGYLRKRYDGDYQYRYDNIHIVGDYSSPIEAAYNMVIWLLENNYIKK